ncbi:MAG: SusE domain-containing protein [Tannerellaceae bacterium]|nr:SusE domain-containing protein [Tannerellaceae bacterium]
MNNKILFAPIAFLMLAFGVFTSCDDDKEFKNVAITAVEKLYEPTDGKVITLENVSGVFFEWEKASAEDNSIVYYDVLFTKENGDFSNPDYVLTSDNNGSLPSVTVSAKEMNRIAGLLGIEMGGKGSIKWTVRSNRGLNTMLAKESKEFSVIRLSSIDLEGADLYIGGDGAEAGRKFVDKGNNVLEIYTQLKANQEFYLYSEKNEEIRYFELTNDNGVIKEVENIESTTVNNNAVYCITVDLDARTVNFSTIDKITIFFCWTSAQQEFTYQGNGTWFLSGYNVELVSTDWGFDERYKFVYTTNGSAVHWGQKNPNDSRPTLSSNQEYWDLAPQSGTGAWDGDPFKFPNEVCDADNLSKYLTDITIYMNAEEGYTHQFSNIREK